MRVVEILTNLTVPDVDQARAFYADFLGLSQEEMNQGWVARFTQPQSRVSVQVVTRDKTAPVDSVATLKVDDVDAAHAEAQAAGIEIVHPLTTEEWGVRRFFVRAPDGNVFNIAQTHEG